MKTQKEMIIYQKLWKWFFILLSIALLVNVIILALEKDDLMQKNQELKDELKVMEISRDNYKYDYFERLIIKSANLSIYNEELK